MSIQQLAQWFRESNRAVAFTGAGMSTESGIPDFRSPGGIWATSTPVYFDQFLASEEARYEYWRQKAIAHRDFEASRPNSGHLALAQWEASGQLQGVVTQNIDGLHQIAGSRRVIELHGTARFVACLDCGSRFGAGEMVAQFLQNDEVPPCPDCDTGRIKHATISFGQSLDAVCLKLAAEMMETADLVLAMGSSLVVEPAASFPRIAKAAGARLVIINRDATPLDSIADLVLHEGIGESLGRVTDALA